MKKTIFIGRSGAGKTTLIEALRGEELIYRKTQYISYESDFMDTPGEYAEGNDLGGALAVYSYESDVVALVISATDGYSIFTERFLIVIISPPLFRKRRFLDFLFCFADKKREVSVTWNH